MEKLEGWLKRVYGAGGDRATLDRLYNEWANNYDRHLWSSGNPYIAISAGMAGKYIRDYEARILDAGCGTGNMGQVLFQMGFNNLEGLDPSDGMLMVAKQKGIYQKLHDLYLDTRVDLTDESYDAVIAAGVLTHGHAPPESLDGMLALTKPAGIIIFSLPEIANDKHGFGEKLNALEADGVMLPLEQSRLFRTFPFSQKEAHIRHCVYVYRKA